MESSPSSWNGRNSMRIIITMLKAIYRFNEIPIKIPTQFFIKLGGAILKFICNKKIPQGIKTILNNKRSSGGITVPNFKQY